MPKTTPKQKQGDYSTVTLDNRVRVRLSKVKAGDVLKGEGEEGAKKSLKLPQAQKEKLESSVKQELEKAGLDTGGKRVGEDRVCTLKCNRVTSNLYNNALQFDPNQSLLISM